MSLYSGVVSLCMEDRHAYTLTDAARILDTSEGALRQRIRRGTLESFKEHGRVYVYIPVQHNVHTPESHTLRSADARVKLLERELEQAHEREAEMRRLLAAALERIPPQLDAPAEPTQTVEEEPEGGNSSSGVRVGVAASGARFLLVLAVGALSFSFGSLLITTISAGGDSLASTISSVFAAFSTAISSGVSALSGDQWVTIISAIFTVIGGIVAAYLGVRWNRRGRSQ
jgi:hypothetical protein